MSGPMRSLAFLVDVMLLATIYVASPAVGRTYECTCLPKQWEGNMATWQRMFDVATGNWLVSEHLWTVHYDHQRLHLAAMVSTTSDTKIVYDSLRGVMYVLDQRGCHGIITGSTIEQTCAPAFAEDITYLHLPSGRAVVRWWHIGPQNTTTSTTVALKTCLPLSQDVYSTYKGDTRIVTSVFSHVRRGIADEGVFDVPPGCGILSGISPLKRLQAAPPTVRQRRTHINIGFPQMM